MSDHSSPKQNDADSERSSDRDEDDEYDEWEQWELDCLARVPSLPQELQLQIASWCDMESLATLSRVNKQWRERTMHLLWTHLDFFEAFEDEKRQEKTRVFFGRCSQMMDTDPKRFVKLAANVRTLHVGRLFGINVLLEEPKSEYEWFTTNNSNDGNQLNCFDVIGQFENLESLSIYIKSYWGGARALHTTSEVLAQSLPNLRSLAVGGQMPQRVLQALVTASPGNLRGLTLMNLVHTPGQSDGPDPVTFLTEDICSGLTALESLHLCKFADLHGAEWSDDEFDEDGFPTSDNDHEYASGMRWRFPREEELGLLGEWAMLLRHTSKTLKSLTLENRYLCGGKWQAPGVDSDFIEPGKTHPAEYGAHSIRESQRVLFLVLFEKEWPKLENLTLVGMGTADSIHESLAHLEERVQIRQLPARYQIMMGDVTPDEISTPVEFVDPPWEGDDDVHWGDDGNDGDGNGDETSENEKDEAEKDDSGSDSDADDLEKLDKDE